MRDIYTYSKGKIYKKGNRKAVPFKKIEGNLEVYRLKLNDGSIAYLKESKGATDYAEIIANQICKKIEIPCVETQLSFMDGFPNMGTKLSYNTFVAKTNQKYGVMSKDSLAKFYAEYEKWHNSQEAIPAILSYDYRNNSEFANSTTISLSNLFNIYNETNSETTEKSINTYLDIINTIAFSNSKDARRIRDNLGLRGTFTIEKDFALKLKRILLMGFITGQNDMEEDNVHIAFSKRKGFQEIHIVPLFHNTYSFNLARLDIHSDKQNLDMLAEETLFTPKIAKYNKNHYDMTKLKEDLVHEIITDFDLFSTFDRMRGIYISDICEEIGSEETHFPRVTELATKVFNLRRGLIEKELAKQVTSIQQSQKERKPVYPISNKYRIQKTEKKANKSYHDEKENNEIVAE